MGKLQYFEDFCKMQLLLFLVSLGVPSCLGGETCSISQGSTTVTAYCESSCCSTKCCTDSETEGISTVAIVLSVLVAIIAILIIVVLVIISYRKKKPACCYRKKEGEDGKRKVLEDGKNSPTNLMSRDINKKENAVDECSSGYSSSQSVKSVNAQKRPVARPASPFIGESGSPVLSKQVPLAMSLPRSTAMPPPPGSGFDNPAFYKSGDRTEILNMKKHQGSKTVTFKNRIDSPRGSIAIPTTDKIRPQYPPRLPPLLYPEKTSSDLFSTNSRSGDSPTEKPATGRGHDRRHRKSYPAENRIGSMWDDDGVKPKTTLFEIKPSSVKAPQRTKTSPTTDSPTNSQLISNIFDVVQSPKRTRSSRRDNTDYNVKESAYVPTIVQAADSRDSVNSVEQDENKDLKNETRNNSFSSPYLTTPYVIKKNRRAPATSNGLGPLATSSPTKKSGETSNKFSGELANGPSTYVSSFMQQKTSTSNTTRDSPV